MLKSFHDTVRERRRALKQRSLVRAGGKALRIGDNTLFWQGPGQPPAQPDHEHGIRFASEGWTIIRAWSHQPKRGVGSGLGVPRPHASNNHRELVIAVLYV